MESECAMFHADIVEAAARSFGSQGAGTSRGHDTKGERGLTCRTPEAADSSQQAKRSTTWVVTETQTRVWEEFGEAMKQDFQLVLKKFR